MYEFIWSSSFVKAYKKITKNNIIKKNRILDVLEIMSNDPFDPRLKTHKLHWILKNLQSSYIDYDTRLIFAIDKEINFNKIILIDIGTHEEVY